ncbi:unnamed protein product [Calypogeia fissa]
MSSYYDLDDILMEEEYVSVTFIVKANGVAVIDPGSEDDNVEQGANVDIPLWLAQDLFSRQAALIKLPYFFNDRIRKEIQADAACVDLRRCCPYFYELGCRLVTLTQDATLGSFLLYALQGRYKDMLCKAHTVALSTPPKFLPLLTREEVNMFESGRNSMRGFNKWRLHGARLERAAVLGRKRQHNILSCPFDLA